MLPVGGLSTILALRSVSKVCAAINGGQEDLEDKAYDSRRHSRR